MLALSPGSVALGQPKNISPWASRSLLARSSLIDRSEVGLSQTWLDLSGDGGVLKRIVAVAAGAGSTNADAPRRRYLCNIDLELRLVHDGVAGDVIGGTNEYKFMLKSASELAEIRNPFLGNSVKGLHLLLPTMRPGEVRSQCPSRKSAMGSLSRLLSRWPTFASRQTTPLAPTGPRPTYRGTPLSRYG